MDRNMIFEGKSRALSSRNHLVERTQTNRSSKEFCECDAKVDLFSDYAETDLDQPTDYSLRYAEDDTDEEVKQQEEEEGTEYFPGSEQEDTIKTYCTEGTPYETPFNFSTATSMLDLRLEDVKDNGDVSKKISRKEIEMINKSPVSFIKQELVCNETEDLVVKELEDNTRDTAVLISGDITPEKIINYYEEETCHDLSRANSLSSLNSPVTFQTNIPEAIEKLDSTDHTDKELETDNHNILNDDELKSVTESKNISEDKNNPHIMGKKGKIMEFNDQDYNIEVTPLMFSRSSSLSSLNGFEQHSIHDDHSSVISDFSRRTSGAISPSELPDSPTQTVLPSPRGHKTHNAEFMSKIQEEGVRPPVRRLLYSKPEIAKNSFFEDEIATFKEESTPVEFSDTTSLSSLTIDDDIKIFNDTKACCKSRKESDVDERIHKLQSDMHNMTVNSIESKTSEEQVSDIDEDDEDMLAACISRGMQTNRYRQSLNSLSSVQSQPLNILAQHQKNSISNRLELHVPVTSTERPISLSNVDKTAMEIVDTVHVYCTEDTPGGISPVSSQSNLSFLSMLSVQEDVEKFEEDKLIETECSINDSFDESPHLSCEDEQILNECIQSGMQKARKPIASPANSIVSVKKLETSHKFNICDIPVSSVEINYANKSSMSVKSLNSESSKHIDELSDGSSIPSDDEALLAECIQSAMLKIRYSKSPSIKTSISQAMENPKATNIRTSPTSSTVFEAGHVEQRKNVSKKSLEENISLSDEENIILAQCIKSGMPKVLKSLSARMQTVRRSEPCLKTTNFSVLSPSYSTNKAYLDGSACIPSSCKSMNINQTERSRGNVSINCNCLRNRAINNVTQTSCQILRNCDNSIRERLSSSPCCLHRSAHVKSDNGNVIDYHAMSSRCCVLKCNAPIFNMVENNVSYMKPNIVHHNSVNPSNENSSQTIAQRLALIEMYIASGLSRNKSNFVGYKSGHGTLFCKHDDSEPTSENNLYSYNPYHFGL